MATVVVVGTTYSTGGIPVVFGDHEAIDPNTIQCTMTPPSFDALGSFKAWEVIPVMDEETPNKVLLKVGVADFSGELGTYAELGDESSDIEDFKFVVSADPL